MSRRPWLPVLIGLAACSSSSSGGSFEVASRSLSFDTVVAGSGASQQLRITAKGDVTVQVAGVGAGIDVTPAKLELSDGETGDFTVDVTAMEPGRLSSTFTLRAGTFSQQVAVNAIVVVSAISVSPQVGFGEVAVGSSRSAKVPITNLLPERISVTVVIPSGDPNAFTTSTQAPVVLEPRGVAEIEVLFAPPCVGDVSGTLVLKACAGCADTNVTLSGQATGSAFAVSPGLLEFPNTPPRGRRVKELTVTNHACTPATLDSAEAVGVPAAPAVALPLALPVSTPVKVPVAFTPDAAQSYSGDLTLVAGARSQRVLVRGQGGGPEIEASPADLDVGVRSADGAVPAVATVTLRRAGDPGKLPIAAVEVVDGPFSVEVAPALPFDLAAGPLTATVTLTSTTVGDHEGALRVRAEDDGQPEIVVPVHGRVVSGDACEAQVTPATTKDTPLRLGLVAERDVRVREVRVRNIGTKECQAWGFRIEGGTYFSVQDAPRVAVIPAGGEHVVKVAYAPTRSSGLEELARLTFQLMGAASRSEVQVSALATPYDVRPEPARIDLGEVPVGAQVVGLTAVVNHSPGKLNVSSVKMVALPSLQVAALPRLPRSIAAGGLVPAFVSFDPVREGIVRGELEIEIAALGTLIVPVEATGRSGPCGAACTTTLAVCPPAQEALVGEKVPMLGVARAGDGGDAGCTWELVSAPQGSTSTVAPGACASDLTPDLPGDYQMRLTGSAPGGDASCEATLHVPAFAGLRVLLDWNAPEDVDLHLIHPSAGADPSHASAWFVAPHDCWFANAWPFWDGSSRDDDPQLIRDDQLGAGPEEIRLPQPTSDHPYWVGAHWANVENSSPSVDATARIYCGDRLAATATARLGSKFDGAFLGTVTWGPGNSCTFVPDGTVIRVAPR